VALSICLDMEARRLPTARELVRDLMHFNVLYGMQWNSHC
jgi:hypothetical protein